MLLFKVVYHVMYQWSIAINQVFHHVWVSMKTWQWSFWLQRSLIEFDLICITMFILHLTVIYLHSINILLMLYNQHIMSVILYCLRSLNQYIIFRLHFNFYIMTVSLVLHLLILCLHLMTIVVLISWELLVLYLLLVFVMMMGVVFGEGVGAHILNWTGRSRKSLHFRLILRKYLFITKILRILRFMLDTIITKLINATISTILVVLFTRFLLVSICSWILNFTLI